TNRSQINIDQRRPIQGRLGQVRIQLMGRKLVLCLLALCAFGSGCSLVTTATRNILSEICDSTEELTERFRERHAVSGTANAPQPGPPVSPEPAPVPPLLAQSVRDVADEGPLLGPVLLPPEDDARAKLGVPRGTAEPTGEGGRLGSPLPKPEG